MTYIMEVQEDSNGESIVQFPVELLNQMGWTEETLIEWIISDDVVTVREVKDAGSMSEG
jgi:hypothetical protein